ncbi:hypothetical protein DV096_16375 [Bradymonadaceae bacterium TMQ3]|uniref:Uncharacterized protein n=1 Tax=Lujinxingia sediminis TaxID=2480984 RepID=A0ABY0CQQ4_9DELT|nr:hypothetical protein [Lujinxingia sediminis]RDV37083.1 hypothetical protein DV096_16375 [Bradymonadaceae bacterium TMQ3]RVU42474.1 hypothetical protein EA187_16485 [Lujinxingia sediminis]TXC74673.1 hypothetical protein FRC91_16305 [Bradymonadales bacterium TMQ1]
MADKRLKAEATYSGVSDKDMNAFRNDLLSEMTTNNVGGYMVSAEGASWIDIEGDEFDVDDIANYIDNSGIFATFNVESVVTITSRKLNDAYLYYKNLAPVTSVP